ncbi:MAG: flagellar assembly protein T N-terminal domain-containing protein [Elusimicrobia bacterium]|nr:flagellar assembly protein T N-terminal domain-containing protein [Elusimicrobiota bacterium]
MKRYLNILCIVFFALLSGGCSGARRSALNSAYETEVVEAEGQAPIVNGDVVGAKKTALHEAMKNALGLVVGIYVSQEAMVAKAILINDTITSQTEGYIEKYEILKEETAGEFYKTRIRAHVRKEDLSAKLKNLESEPQKLGNPVIGFDIAEDMDGKAQKTNYAELELKNTFADAGFMTGEKEKADILIKGSVKSQFNTGDGLGGFISYRAALSVAAVKQGSGETLAALQETAGGIDLNKSAAAKAAIINAAKRTGEELKEKVLKGLREKSMVRLSLLKVEGMNQLSDFLKSLRNIPMVRGCWLRSLTGDTASIDVGLRKGNASDLSQLLMKNARFPVKINRTSSYDLEAELQMAPGK